eukprot:COSAG01_NODE_1725_length_9377_cov_5.690235_4_plen_374_part_00
MKQVRRGLRKYLPELPPFSRRELHRLSGGALDDGKLSYAEFVTLVEAGQAGKGVPAKRGRRRRARAAGLTISGGTAGSVAPSRGQEEEEADPAGGEESESVGGGSSSVWGGGDESTEAADSAHAHSVVSHGTSAVGGGGGAGSEQAQAPPAPGSAAGKELALPLPSELRDELAAMQRRGEGGEGAEAEAEAGRRAAAAVGARSMTPRTHAQLCRATSVATSGLGPSAACSTSEMMTLLVNLTLAGISQAQLADLSQQLQMLAQKLLGENPPPPPPQGPLPPLPPGAAATAHGRVSGTHARPRTIHVWYLVPADSRELRRRLALPPIDHSRWLTRCLLRCRSSPSPKTAARSSHSCLARWVPWSRGWKHALPSW